MSVLAAKLVAKDFRLSLDMLLPWGLIVGGTALVGLVLTRLPSTMLPETIGQLSVSGILFMVGMLAAATCVVAAAWLAAVVAQGDRIHGAEHLVAALPIAPWRRGAAKLLVIALVAAVPVVVSLGMFVAGVATDSRTDGVRFGAELWDLDGPLAFVIGTSIVGVGLSLGVSQLVRGPFRVVAVALLLGVVGGVLGYVGSSLSFGRVTAELATMSDGHGWASDGLAGALQQAQERANVVAGATGAGVIALVGLAIGIAAIARPRHPGLVIGALACGVALAPIGGAIATVVSVRGDSSLKSAEMWDLRVTTQWAQRLSDVALAWTVEKEAAVVGSQGQITPHSWAIMTEVASRLKRLNAAELRDSPLMSAAVAVQDDSTAQRAMFSISMLPPGTERERRLLSAAKRYPDERCFLDLLLMYVPLPLPPGGGQLSPEAATEWSVQKLRLLQERYPDERESLEAMIARVRGDGRS